VGSRGGCPFLTLICIRLFCIPAGVPAFPEQAGIALLLYCMPSLGPGCRGRPSRMRETFPWGQLDSGTAGVSSGLTYLGVLTVGVEWEFCSHTGYLQVFPPLQDSSSLLRPVSESLFPRPGSITSQWCL